MTIDFNLKEALELWGLDRASPYHGMLLDFIEQQARRLAGQLPRPETKEAWLTRATALRPRLFHSLGLSTWPDRTPLNARITGRIERPGFSIEKLIYEPRPGFFASAHLYLPRPARLPD